MNQAEYLCHSSGPWKNHKYFQKIGEGANAVYKYAKDKGTKLAGGAANVVDDIGRPKTSSGDYILDRGPKAMYDYYVTGEGYKKRADAKNWTGDPDAIRRQTTAAQKDYKERSLAGKLGVGERDRYYNAQDKYLSNKNSNRSTVEKNGLRDTAHAAKQAYDKTPLGKMESAGAKAKTKVSQISKSAKSTVAKGEKILKDFLTPKVTETVTNVSTGEKRTPSHSGTTINIKTGKVTRR